MEGERRERGKKEKKIHLVLEERRRGKDEGIEGAWQGSQNNKTAL